MELHNSNKSDGSSQLLVSVRDLAGERNIKVEVRSESSPTKGELIISIAEVAVTGVATNALYDLLKVAAKRLVASKPTVKNETIEVDGQERSIDDIANDKK